MHMFLPSKAALKLRNMSRRRRQVRRLAHNSVSWLTKAASWRSLHILSLRQIFLVVMHVSDCKHWFADAEESTSSLGRLTLICIVSLFCGGTGGHGLIAYKDKWLAKLHLAPFIFHSTYCAVRRYEDLVNECNLLLHWLRKIYLRDSKGIRYTDGRWNVVYWEMFCKNNLCPCWNDTLHEAYCRPHYLKGYHKHKLHRSFHTSIRQARTSLQVFLDNGPYISRSR